MNIRHTTFRFQTTAITALITAIICSATTGQSLAGNLNLADNALEVTIGVEPNIVILADDSGSMDWGAMTEEADGIAHLNGLGYWYVHPAPGASGSTPATNSWTYVVPSEEFMSGEGLAAPYGGVWRYWYSGYNTVYYNPEVTYTPWAGVDSTGADYTDASPTAAPYDPYYPGNGTLDLTTTTTYSTDCGLTGCSTITALSGVFTVTNFYPARYYTWDDTTNTTTASDANNGVVDEGDGHTLVEIKSTTSSYSRSSYDEDTGYGRSDCTDNGNGTATCTYAQEIQNFANWFSYYRKRDLTAKAALSGVIKTAENARIGFATINNSTSNNEQVASMNVSPKSGAKKIILDTLYETSPSGSTPLRTALDKTGKYFDCDSSNIMGTSSGSPGSSGCPVEASPAGQCQQNYAVLMTDGYWNDWSSPGVGDADSSNGSYSGGAFGDNNASTISNTLADVAMYYYKNDLHGGLSDEVPTTANDIARYRGTTSPFETMHQHMATYTVGFGVEGTLSSNPSDPDDTSFVWPDPTSGDAEKIDDLRHAAYNGRGQFLNAANPVALASAIDDIFNEIKTATGTATAVAFNTQEVEAGTLVFRASFNTKNHVGDLVAQKVYSDGTIDSNIEWSAAEQLDSKVSSSSDSRVIISYKDTGSSSSTGIPFSWSSLSSGSGSQQETLDSPQPANVASSTNTFGDERLDWLRGHSDDEGPNGDDGEFRERPSTEGKLGDIVHSTPVFVGKPQYTRREGGAYPATTGNTYAEFVDTYNARTEITYVGANDGMLHAIDTSDGSEVFAYIPNLVFENLSDLTDPDYSHQFYVDLTPAVNDAYFTPSGGTNNGTLSWNTVLVGGLGAGGKGYYALNVTNPDHLDSESEAKENVLWEFGEADDGGVGSSDLGYTFSRPLIAMSNADDGSGNKVWVVIFGNGYNSTSTDGDSALYILRLDGGQDGVWTSSTDFVKISTGYGKAESSDGATPNGIGGVRGIDTDGNGTVDYVYAGDLQGHLYRFDLTDTSMSSWDVANSGGKAIPLFSAEYSVDGTPQPITTRPIVINHPTDAGYVVITSTGSWMTTDDASSTDIQSIYGIWDNMDSSGFTVEHDFGGNEQLVEQVFTNHVNTEHGYTVRTLTNNAVAWKDTGNAANKVKGWFVDLDVLDAATGTTVEYPGERAVRNLQIRGGVLFVNTIIPKSTSACSVGAGGFELGFNPENGGSGSNIIFDLNGDGNFSELDNVNDTAGDSYIVTGIRFDTDMPTDSAFIGNRRMTQEGDDIRSFSTNTGDSTGSGRTSWREIVN